MVFPSMDLIKIQLYKQKLVFTEIIQKTLSSIEISTAIFITLTN